MYTRETVIVGSTITRSPSFVVTTNSFLRRYCSATKGEMLDLKRPVPTKGQLRNRLESRLSQALLTKTHNNECNNEGTDRTLVLNHTGNRSDDEENMTYESNKNGYADCLVTTPICVCDIGTKKRCDVAPWQYSESIFIDKGKLRYQN